MKSEALDINPRFEGEEDEETRCLATVLKVKSVWFLCNWKQTYIKAPCFFIYFFWLFADEFGSAAMMPTYETGIGVFR